VQTADWRHFYDFSIDKLHSIVLVKYAGRAHAAVIINRQAVSLV